MGLPDVDRLVASPGQLTRHGVLVGPRQSVLISHHALSVRGHSRHQRPACADARRAGRVPMGENGPLPRQRVQMGGFRHGVSQAAQAVTPEVVRQHQYDVRSLRHRAFTSDLGVSSEMEG